MFVSMWMTRELSTIGPGTGLAEITALMSRRRIRRLPVVAESPAGPKLLGIISYSDVLHAFPPGLNPLAADAAEQLRTLPAGSAVTASQLMNREPRTTTPDAPLEVAARQMRDHKIGALPVVTEGVLVGLITESDVFRAIVELFSPAGRALRITFTLSDHEDVLPLLAEISRKRSLRVSNFHTMPRHDPPLAVVQLVGEQVEAALDDVWKSKDRVMHVTHLG
jgi:acetoin utilization protein AcuB